MLGYADIVITHKYMYTPKESRHWGEGLRAHTPLLVLPLSEAVEKARLAAMAIITDVRKSPIIETREDLQITLDGKVYVLSRPVYLALVQWRGIVNLEGKNQKLVSSAPLLETVISMLWAGKEIGQFAFSLLQSHPDLIYTEPAKLYSLWKALESHGILEWFTRRVLTDLTLQNFIYRATAYSDEIIELVISEKRIFSESEKIGLRTLQKYIWSTRWDLRAKIDLLVTSDTPVSKILPSVSSTSRWAKVFGMSVGSLSGAFRGNK